MSKPIEFSTEIKVTFLILLFFAAFTSNPLITGASLLYIPISAKLLWRKDEPPVLFLAYLQQWLQVSIKALYANFLDEKLSDIAINYDYIDEAFFLGLISLLIQNLGIFLIIRKIPPLTYQSLEPYFSRIKPNKILILYLGVMVITPILIRFGTGGLQQFVQRLTDLKWGFLILLYLTVYFQPKYKVYFYGILLIEIILGFAGYFSSFKDFFLFLAIAYLTTNSKLRFKQIISGVVFGIGLFYLGATWQIVKPEYRKFLSGGQNAQVVTVSTSESLDKLWDLANNIDSRSLNSGFEELINRVSYIEYFSASLKYVPASIPHENGNILLKAVKHILMPRILFPNKEALDDSSVTRKYTGLAMAGAEEGTSISLGYVAEGYVDAKVPGMLVYVLGVGLLVGAVIMLLYRSINNKLYYYLFLLPMYFTLNVFEANLIKLLGTLVSYIIVTFIIKGYLTKILNNLLFDIAPTNIAPESNHRKNQPPHDFPRNSRRKH